MEKLKSVIPETLRRAISESTANDLHCTCTSLLNFFQNLPLFHQMVRDLTDPELALCKKDKEAALEAKAKGNECFSRGDYSSAMHFYSQALRFAPTDVEDKDINLVASLYLNRAAALQKLGLFMESLRDSSRALMVSPAYAKAWFRRAKANSSLGHHGDAISDLTVSLKIETSLTGKRQIENELTMLLDSSTLRSGVIENSNHDSSDEQPQIELSRVSTSTKGRGMMSFSDIPLASLIHKEDPYAAIILKHCRETHCAFCFNELPADTVPCVSCSTPLYCSIKCQVRDGGQDFPKCENKYEFLDELPDDLQQYIRNVTSPGISKPNIENTAEHRHECQGMHWPAVLPSDVVLVGRILVQHIEQQNHAGFDPKIHGILDLCQNYGQLPSESKLEFHVYSIILIFCLQRYYASKLPLDSAITSEVVLLLSQIRVNSMAIVCMKYSDGKQSLDYGATSSVEQVQVAQAVYSAGSFFNHSCQPNAHAYFKSRTLFVRVTENVKAGSELELSYGPQVGQWACSERRKFLEDRYSFICQCSGCANLNLSDLVHAGYRCTKPNCFGVVLDSRVAKFELEKLKNFKGSISFQGSMHYCDSINRVARRVIEQTNYDSCLEPGYCLNCGSFRDLQVFQNTIAKAEIPIGRLQDAVASGEIQINLLTDALESINILRTVLHPFNKKIAEVEDNIAQTYCLTGELQSALTRCQASIEILETLYGENHVVVANELIKLASIQVSMGQKVSSDLRSRIVAIFSRYYGSHPDIMFPHLRYLKSDASKLV